MYTAPLTIVFAVASGRYGHNVETNNQTRLYSKLIWLVVILGGALRFLPGIVAGFPINDGGMFLQMILDLKANGYSLPPTTSYNFSSIPYAYPPLGFYLVAFLSQIFGISPVHWLLWLPAFVSAAIIPAFYWFALKITDSSAKALSAAALYAFIPGMSDWLIMGGGLTRAFGILFLIIGIGCVYSLLREGGRRRLVLSIFFCSLAVLSHPEVALQAVGICFLLCLSYGSSLRGAGRAFAVALGVGALTSLWWLNILRMHGVAPFASAMQTGIRETLIASLFHTFFSLQGGLPILPVFGLVGIFVAIKQRGLLPVFGFFLPFFVDPRNAPAVAIYFLILLSVEGMTHLKDEYKTSLNKMPGRQMKIAQTLPAILLAGLLIYLLAVSAGAAKRLGSFALTVDDRETMEWIRENTPPDSRFILLTNNGQVNPMVDARLEWFPTLAERRSLNTIQGLEWTLGPRFYQYSLDLLALQACSEMDCIHQWLDKEGFHADYILLMKKRASPTALDSLRDGQVAEVVYDSPNTIIFRLVP